MMTSNVLAHEPDAVVLRLHAFGFSDSHMNGILSVARRNNARNQITGALVCRADLYLQMLERPWRAVTATFHRILRDDPHLDIELIRSNDIETRLLPEWHMRDDPARSWMWTQAQVANGAVDAASADDVRAVFSRLVREPD
jgi:Sensors of blue-light using FAD